MRPILALAVLGLLAGCSTPEAPEPAASTQSILESPFETPDTPGEAPASEAPAVPYEFRTAILDSGYEHPRLDAATQATIRWRNAGQETHSVVSDDGTFPGSGPIAPGSDFSFTFQTPGDYAFHCRYHDAMKGVLVVR